MDLTDFTHTLYLFFHFSIDFTVYLPDLFGGDTDQVETHVSEPTEPVDVRKNRQLTLDNMKLHRELEKLKQSASEYDLVKKELRNVKTKLDEEQKLRSKMEHQLDMHNKKVYTYTYLIYKMFFSVEMFFEQIEIFILRLLYS